MKLYAPELYWTLTPESKKELCNGCGPKGFGLLIPDTIYGLVITEVCDIHDFMFAIGVDEEDRLIANRVFRNNLLRYIDYKTKWKWLKKLRIRRALKYIYMVDNCSGPAFWRGKNEPETEQDIS